MFTYYVTNFASNELRRNPGPPRSTGRSATAYLGYAVALELLRCSTVLRCNTLSS